MQGSEGEVAEGHHWIPLHPWLSKPEKNQIVLDSSCSVGDLDRILGKISPLKGWSNIGTTVPRRVQKPYRCDA